MGGVIGQGRVPNHVPARRIAKVSCVNRPKGYNAEPLMPLKEGIEGRHGRKDNRQLATFFVYEVA